MTLAAFIQAFFTIMLAGAMYSLGRDAGASRAVSKLFGIAKRDSMSDGVALALLNGATGDCRDCDDHPHFLCYGCGHIAHARGHIDGEPHCYLCMQEWRLRDVDVDLPF